MTAGKRKGRNGIGRVNRKGIKKVENAKERKGNIKGKLRMNSWEMQCCLDTQREMGISAATLSLNNLCFMSD